MSNNLPVTRLVAFALDEKKYALHLSCVERVIPVVEIVSLPQAPEIVLGVVNVGGEIFPVFNIRKRFHLPPREMDLADQLILAHTAKRKIALWVDQVLGVVVGSELKVVASQKILPHVEYVEGVVKLEEGMVLIHNLDSFLSLDEERVFDSTMRKT